MQERFSGGFDSPLGKIRIEALNGKITLLIFENQRFAPESAAVCRKGGTEGRCESEDKTGSGASEYAVKSAIRWLEEYFSGAVPPFTPPLSFEGATAFRRKVWDRLLLIPYGKTATYGEIAADVFRGTGKKPSARAVGGAVGHNPIAVIVPCHRVLAPDGNITGYGGGLRRKTALLRLEKALPAGFYMPPDAEKWQPYDSLNQSVFGDENN